MSFWDYLNPNVGTGFLHILCAATNLLLCLCAVMLCAYLFPRFRKGAREVKREKPTKPEWGISTAIVGAFVGLGYFVSLHPVIPSASSGYTIYEVLQWLVDRLDPLLDISGLRAEPLHGFIGLNLLTRIMALFAFFAAIRFAKHYIARMAARFSSYLEKKLEKQVQETASEEERTKAGEEPAGEEKQKTADGKEKAWERSFEKILKGTLGVSGLSIFAYVFGPEQAQDAIAGIIGSLGTFIQQITTLSQLQTGDIGFAGYLYNVMIVLSSLFILAIYVTAIVLFISFVVAVKRNWSQITKKLEGEDGQRRLWRIMGIMGIAAVCVTLFVVMSSLLQSGFFQEALASGAGATLKGAVHIILLLLMFCVVVVIAILLGAFVIWACNGIFRGVKNAIQAERQKQRPSKKIPAHMSAVELIKHLLGMLTDVLALIPLAVGKVCNVAKSVVVTGVQIFTGYRNELEKNKALFLAACFASLASLINTFWGLKKFYSGNSAGNNSPVLIVCALAIAFAVQLAMLIFGLKAGEGAAERRMREGPRRKQAKEQVGSSQGCRITPWKRYLLCYLLLMMVSTTFAYTNMLGYYADVADLRQQVYDQVRYKAEHDLNLIPLAEQLVDTYQENETEFLAEFTKRSAQALTDRETITAFFQEAGVAEGNRGSETFVARDRHSLYKAETEELENLVSAIRAIATMDAKVLGKDNTITIIELKRPVGIRSVRVACVLVAATGRGTHTLVQAGDPSTGSALATRTISNADKYTILKELLNQYARVEEAVYNVTAQQGETFPQNITDVVNRGESYRGKDNSKKTLMETLYSPLNENIKITTRQENILALCNEEATDRGELRELPHIIRTYLDAVDPDADDPEADDHAKLDDYLNKSIKVYEVLSGVKTEDDLQNDRQTDQSPAFQVREYQNYAQSIAHSDLRVGLDILTRGGLNPHRKDINTMYSAFWMAVFILAICALVDLMPLFCGRLLFKNIYLFEPNGSIQTIGYLNYEALLIDLFALPEEDNERLLHLAFLYVIVHGDASGKKQVLPSSMQGYEKLHAILQSVDFKQFFEVRQKILGGLGIDLNDTKIFAQFQAWVNSFVQQEDIDFTPLFQ